MIIIIAGVLIVYIIYKRYTELHNKQPVEGELISRLAQLERDE
jgi:hypothetical protein